MLQKIFEGYQTQYAWISVLGHYLFLKLRSQNCLLLRTDNGHVQTYVFEHILAPNGGYCSYTSATLYRPMQV